MPERFKVVCIPCKALYNCSALPLQDPNVLETQKYGRPIFFQVELLVVVSETVHVHGTD